jgi:hypothetical protein
VKFVVQGNEEKNKDTIYLNKYDFIEGTFSQIEIH